MISRIVMAAGLSAAIALPAAAQNASGGAAPPPVPVPAVGQTAPDFSGIAADKNGVLPMLKLADLKGKTVVLAFFPKARTSGCTQQMTQYKAQYDSLFMGGKDVVLLGISTDLPDTLAAWAKDAQFPFKFVSDKDRAIGLAYGTLSEAQPTGAERRNVYVIGPDGKIAYVKERFSPFTPAQYDTLRMEIHKATPHGHK